MVAQMSSTYAGMADHFLDVLGPLCRVAVTTQPRPILLGAAVMLARNVCQVVPQLVPGLLVVQVHVPDLRPKYLELSRTREEPLPPGGTLAQRHITGRHEHQLQFMYAERPAPGSHFRQSRDFDALDRVDPDDRSPITMSNIWSRQVPRCR